MSIKFSLALLAVVFCQALASSVPYYPRPCYPKRIANGYYYPTGRTIYPGKSVTYSCKDDFTLVGNAVVKCTFFGLVGKPPRCVPKPRGCSAPARDHFPAGMTYRPVKPKYSVNEKLWLSCRDGYTLKVRHPSDESIACLASGNFGAVRAYCQRNGCPDPIAPENGYIKGRKPFNVGTKIWFKCNAGFVIEGKKDFICLPTGQWNGNFPVCNPIIKCDSLGSLDNGAVDPLQAKYDVGAEVNYECSEGFELDGEPLLTCQDDGEFDHDKPTCNEIFCEAIPIDNGSFTPDKESISVGEDVIYSCEDGYVLDGQQTLQCQADGQFDDEAPICVPIQCAFPGEIDNGSPDSEDEFYDIGQTITYTCEEGYALDGEGELTCENDGQFDNELPTCVPIKCPKPPKISNGYVKGNDYSVGRKVWVICSKYYVPVGKKDLTCLASGEWNGEFATCVRPGCPQPTNPANGYIKGKRSSYSTNNKIWFICSKGFVINGKKDLTCLSSGRWNAPYPTCVPAGCPQQPKPANGYIKGKKASYETNDKIWLKCNRGFVATGKKDLTCLSSGKWNGVFGTCIRPVTCSRPARISYGYYRPYKRSYSANEKVKYSCRSGYFLDGEDDVKCGTNGKWAPLGQKCLSHRSCRNRCHRFIKGASCQCNDACKIYRNCCSDKVSRCH